jgi:hypothetical protein
MKYTIISTLFIISFEIIEYFYGHDITDFLHQDNLIYDFLVAFPFILIGGFLDFINKKHKKMEAEKRELYYETMLGVNHLVRNLQNNFSIINTSEAIKEEFGNDIIELLNESSSEVENIISQLTQLENLDPELVKKISSSNVTNT